MSRPKVPQTKRTYLIGRITASESSLIRVNRLQDQYGNNLSMADFGDKGYLTLSPGTDNTEIIAFTGFTVNDDDTVDIDTGIERGRSAVSPYEAGGTARSHYGGTPAIVSNNPQLFEAILDYIDSVVNAGAADGDTETAGLFEEATVTELNEDTPTGGTSRRTVANPQRLAASKYGQRLPTATEKDFLGIATGAIVPFAGLNAPSGWLECDGQSIAFADYPDLAEILLARYGLNADGTFTVDTSTDYITATSHGLSDDDRIMLISSDTLPAGLSENTMYFVINSTANTFQVATSSGGSAVDITDTGTGTHKFTTTAKVPDLRGSVVIGKGQKTVTIDFDSTEVTLGDTLTVSDTDASSAWVEFNTNHGLATGDPIVFATGFGSVSADNVYYAIKINNTQIYLAGSYENALNDAQTFIGIDGASGHTAYKVASFSPFEKIPENLYTGSLVSLSTDGTLPTPVSAGDFYLIRVDDFTFKLAKTISEAIAGIGVALTDVGSGTHSILFSLTDRILGNPGGEEDHALTVPELPAHNHNHGSSSEGSSGTGYYLSTGTGNSMRDAGENEPHNNMPPFVVTNWLIKT